MRPGVTLCLGVGCYRLRHVLTLLSYCHQAPAVPSMETNCFLWQSLLFPWIKCSMYSERVTTKYCSSCGTRWSFVPEVYTGWNTGSRGHDRSTSYLWEVISRRGTHHTGVKLNLWTRDKNVTYFWHHVKFAASQSFRYFACSSSPAAKNP